jgi:hypothetical protein
VKIEFRWNKEKGRLRPFCSTKDPARGPQILTDLINDDGGASLTTTVDWLLEGVRRIDRVKNQEVDTLNWDRETFGASISRQNIKIYSLHSEDYNENLSFTSFEAALRAWVDFTKSAPSVDLIVEIEV